MSATVAVILERALVHIVRADTPSRVQSIAWSPDDPEAMVNAAREHVPARASIVVVVGLGLLEIAEPELPPLDRDERRQLLLRDADRYFPLDEPVAVVAVERFAFAVASRRLHAWVRALERIGTVKSIITAPQVAAAAFAAKSGPQTVSMTAAEDERGVMQLRAGVVESVRRVPMTVAASQATTVPASAPTMVDSATLGRVALGWDRAPLHAQLLDFALAQTAITTQRRRWMFSTLAFAASLAVLAWAVDGRRERTLRGLDDRARALTQTSAPAVLAEARASRAASELELLSTALATRQSPDVAIDVMAQLSRVLPRDAFVQRLEWDGTLWRIDGTTDNAPRLVPLLDADAHFRDVRIAASSQRFLDVGRQRETFSISFRARSSDSVRSGAPSAGGVNGAP